MQSTPNRLVSTFIGLGAPLMWSIYPVLLLSAGGIPPFQALSIGFSISFCLSLIIWRIRGISLKDVFVQPLRYWVIGVGGILCFNSLYTLSLTHSPPAEAFLIASSWPLIALLLDALILKERLRPNHIIGCLLGLSGLVFLAINRGADGLETKHFLGYLAALISAFVWGGYSVAIKRDAFPIPEFIGAICGVVAIGAACMHFLLEPTMTLEFSQWWRLLLIGVGPVGLAYYCWNFGVQHGDLRSLSSLSFLGHFTATGLLIFFGYAMFTWQVAVAFALIIGGAFIGSMYLRKN